MRISKHRTPHPPHTEFYIDETTRRMMWKLPPAPPPPPPLELVEDGLATAALTTRTANGLDTAWAPDVVPSLRSFLSTLAQTNTPPPLPVPQGYHGMAAASFSVSPGQEWSIPALSAALADSQILTLKEDQLERPDLAFAVAAGLLPHPQGAGVRVVLVAVWRSPSLVAAIRLEERRVERARMEGKPHLVLAWDSFPSVLAEEVVAMRHHLGLGETLFPIELFLMLSDAFAHSNSNSTSSPSYTPASYINTLATPTPLSSSAVAAAAAADDDGPSLPLLPEYNTTRSHTLHFAHSTPGEALVEALASPLFAVPHPAGYAACIVDRPAVGSKAQAAQAGKVLRIVAQWYTPFFDEEEPRAGAGVGAGAGAGVGGSTAREAERKHRAKLEVAVEAFGPRPVEQQEVDEAIKRLAHVSSWFSPPQTVNTLDDVVVVMEAVREANARVHVLKAQVDHRCALASLPASEQAVSPHDPPQTLPYPFASVVPAYETLVHHLRANVGILARLGGVLLPPQQSDLASFIMHALFEYISSDEQDLYILLSSVVLSEITASESVKFLLAPRPASWGARLLEAYMQRRPCTEIMHGVYGQALRAVVDDKGLVLSLDPAASLRATAAGTPLHSASRTLPLRQQILAIEATVASLLNAGTSDAALEALPPFVVRLLIEVSHTLTASSSDHVHGSVAALLLRLTLMPLLASPELFGFHAPPGSQAERNLGVIRAVLEHIMEVARSQKSSGTGDDASSSLLSTSTLDESVVSLSGYVYEPANPLSLMQAFVEEAVSSLEDAVGALLLRECALPPRPRQATTLMATSVSELSAVHRMLQEHLRYATGVEDSDLLAGFGNVPGIPMAVASFAEDARVVLAIVPPGIDRRNRSDWDMDLFEGERGVSRETGPGSLQLLRDASAMIQASSSLPLTEDTVSHAFALAQTLWVHRVNVAAALQQTIHDLEQSLDLIRGFEADLGAILSALGAAPPPPAPTRAQAQGRMRRGGGGGGGGGEGERVVIRF